MKYYLDLQIHTSRHSPCSTIAAEEVIAAARARRLDGIALTEHSYCWSADAIERLKAAAPGAPLTVLAGFEIRARSADRPAGDLLVFGVAEVPPGDCSIDELCREVHGQGGIVIAPHPFAQWQGIGEEVYSSHIDGLEVCNYRYRDAAARQRAEQAWRQLGLVGIATSDAHDTADIGQFCTEFDVPIRNDRDLIEAIRQRRCRPYARIPPGWLFRRLWKR